MTIERGRELESKADGLRKSGKYEPAAEYYSIAAFECFGESVPSEFGQVTSFGEEFLLEAVLCYGIAGNTDQRKNRATIGVLVAEDILSRDLEWSRDNNYDQSRKGAWYEFIGDFKLIGGLGDHGEWYDQAEELYRQHGDPSVGLAEQEHGNLFAFYRVLLRLACEDGPDPTAEDGGTLTGWLSTKRETLPRLAETLLNEELSHDE